MRQNRSEIIRKIKPLNDIIEMNIEYKIVSFLNIIIILIVKYVLIGLFYISKKVIINLDEKE